MARSQTGQNENAHDHPQICLRPAIITDSVQVSASPCLLPLQRSRGCDVWAQVCCVLRSLSEELHWAPAGAICIKLLFYLLCCNNFPHDANVI